MARRWVVHDEWEGGGFFGVGSFDGTQRYNALNMQRYENGSIGPRPQWRKLTQSASGTTIPSLGPSLVDGFAIGAAWVPYASSGWTYGGFILPVDQATYSRRVRINDDGTCVFHVTALSGTTLGNDLLHPTEAVGINAVQAVRDGSNPVYVGGAIYYNPSADVAVNVSPRTVNSASFYPNKLVIHRNRMYGWQSLTSTANDEYIVYSRTTDFTNFDGTDAGDFRLSAAPTGYDPAIPRGLWSLASGLLIFSSEGLTRESSGYPGVTTEWADYGRWYILTGTDPIVGALTQLDYDIGPKFGSLGVVHDNRLLFPVKGEGYAIHDGSVLDRSIMGSVRPGRGQEVDFLWLAPVKTSREQALILPFKTIDVDPTAEGTGTTDRIGEFYNHGYGAFEWVNGAWTEALWNHGQGHRFVANNFDHDKLFALTIDSPDGLSGSGFPQFYVRDICLNRPSISTDAFSDDEETAPSINDTTGTTTTGGATGRMKTLIETAEERSSMGAQLLVEAIVIEYDYWNSDSFDADCGFEVELIYRSSRTREKLVKRITPERVSPPGTSVGLVPKRGRAIFNIDPVHCGTFQVRLLDIVGVAVHAVYVAVEDGKDPYVGN